MSSTRRMLIHSGRSRPVSPCRKTINSRLSYRRFVNPSLRSSTVGPAQVRFYQQFAGSDSLIAVLSRPCPAGLPADHPPAPVPDTSSALGSATPAHPTPGLFFFYHFLISLFSRPFLPSPRPVPSRPVPRARPAYRRRVGRAGGRRAWRVAALHPVSPGQGLFSIHRHSSKSRFVPVVRLRRERADEGSRGPRAFPDPRS